MHSHAFLGLLFLTAVSLEAAEPLPGTGAKATPTVIRPPGIPADAAIVKAICTRVTVNFDRTPLRQALAVLKERGAVGNLRIDEASLREENVDLHSPISLSLKNVTVGQALHHILSPSGLTWIIRNDCLVVMTAVKAEESLVSRVYWVEQVSTAMRETAAIAEVPDEQTGIPRFKGPHRKLLEALEASTSGGGLTETGMKGFRSTIVVAARFWQQQETQQLLDGFEQFLKGNFRKSALAVRPVWNPVTDDLVIRQKLAKRLPNRSFEKVSLREAIRSLEADMERPIVLDLIALNEELISLDEPVTAQFENLSLRSILKELLEPFGGTFHIDHGLLVVTSKVKAEELLTTVLYDVRDLVRNEAELDSLIAAIQEGTGGPWLINVGAAGTVTPAFGGCLIVRQTMKAHDEVADLLAMLRKQLAQDSVARPPADAAP